MDFVGHLSQPGLAHLLQLGTAEHPRRIAGFDDPHLARDGLRSSGVVTGDHGDLDPCCVAGRDGGDGFGPRRIDDADDAEKFQSVLDVTDVDGVRTGRPPGRGQHPQALRTEIVDACFPRGAVERLCGGAAGLGGRPVQQPVRCTFDVEVALTAGGVVERHHELVGRLERHHAQAWPVRIVDSCLQGQCAQRTLGRLAHHPPLSVGLVQACVVAHGHRRQQRCQVGMVGHRDRGPVEFEGTFGPVSGAGDVEQVTRGGHGSGGHLVLCECARLVRADDIDRAECLDGGKLAGDRPPAGHLLYTERQGDGDDCGQPLRYRGNSETYCSRDQFIHRELVHQFADHQHHRGRAQDAHRQLATETRQLASQRGFDGFHVGDQRLDPADLGAGAGGGHHAGARTGRHDGARIHHRHPIAQTGIRTNLKHVLLGGQRLTGQRRLLHPQVRDRQQAHVGRDAVPRRDAHDVAGNQGLCVYLLPVTVTTDLRGHRQHAPDAVQRALGPAFLDQADHGVDDRDGHDHRAIDPVVEDGLEYTRGDQDVDQHIVELREEPENRRPRTLFGELVRTVGGQPLARAVTIQPVARTAQNLKHFGGAAGMRERTDQCIFCRGGRFRHIRIVPGAATPRNR